MGQGKGQGEGGTNGESNMETYTLLLSHFSRVRLLATPWTAAYQAPPSMGFSRQEHWSGLPFPSPGDLPDPGTEPRSPALQAILYQLNYMFTWYLFKN